MLLKLCRFTLEEMSPYKIVEIVTHYDKTIRSTDKDIHVNYNIKYNLDTKEIVERILLAANGLTMISVCSNTKRVGTITHISKRVGNFDLVTLKDARGYPFTTRINYVFVIKKIGKSATTLPKNNGL